MFLEMCMQICSEVFALSRQINKQKYAKTINLLKQVNTFMLNIKLEVFLTPTTLAYAIECTVIIY